MAMITNPDVVGNLDVLNIYRDLMDTSTAEGSVYIRTKETLQDIVDSANLTEREKADIISQTMAAITNSVTNTAMNAAIEIAKENRNAPFSVTKIGAEVDLINAQRDKTLKDADLITKQIEKLDADIDFEVIQGWNIQANMFRDTGVKSEGLSTALPVLTFTGHTVEDGLKVSENKLAHAKTYDAWATSARSSGLVSMTQGIDYMPTSFTYDTQGLMYQQTRVAQRQYQAFDDNKRQHAVNSSASMLGVMIGSSAFTDAGSYTSFLDDWRSAMNYLNTGSVVPIGSVSAGTISASFPATVTRNVNYVVTGTTINVLAGTSVTVEFILSASKVYGAAAIVNMDGTWTVTVPSTITADLAVGSATVKASLVDATGNLISDSATVTIA